MTPMDHLNKQQVVLICVLVALVTSVATAISVVSLTDESGLPTQTIYKVIEKSIDKVADIAPDTVTPSKDVAKPATILMPSDIAQSAAKSMVRIYETTSGEKQFVALGVAFGNKSGVISSTLLNTHGEGATYVAVTPDGVTVNARFVRDALGGGFGLFALEYPQGVKTRVPALELKSISGLKLGDNTVAVGGKESGNVVSTGIVSELRVQKDAVATSTPEIVVTDMTLSSSYSGFLLFDTNGQLVAFEKSISEADRSPEFIDASVLKQSVSGLL